MLFSMLATEAAAGTLTLGSWDGSLEADLGYSKDISNSGGTTSTDDQHNTLYALNLQNSGFSVIDPALMTGTAGLTLGMGKEVSTAEGTTMTSSSGLLGYSLDTEFLNDLPFGGALFATNSHTTVIQPFGYQVNDNSDRGISMRLNEGSPLKDMGFPYLSSNLRLEEQNLNQLSTSILNQNYQHIEDRRSLTWEGHKGAETSDLNWSYSNNDIKQPLTPDGNNRSQNIELDFSDDFGKVLNRRWDSRINYFDRIGVTPLYDTSTLSVNEALQINHQNNFSTNYNYQLLRVISQDVPSDNQVVQLGAMYQPYQNLSTNASFQRQIVPTGMVNSGSVGLGYGYSLGLPRDGTMRFTTGGGYGQTKITSNDTTGQINYEAHPFKFDPLAANQEVTLSQSFVILSAPIVVYAVNIKQNAILGGGPLVACPGPNMPSDGTCDYLILPPLGGKTIFRVNSLSTTLTGLGNNVDTLEVSYSYNAPPSLTYASVTSSTGLTIDYRWIVLSLAHAQSEVSQLTGSGSDNLFLQSTIRDSAQVDLKGSWQQILGTVGTSYVSENDTALVYHQERYYSTATYVYSYNLSFGFNAANTMTQYQNPERTNETDTIRINATWYPVNIMTVNADIGQNSMKDSSQTAEIVDEANVRAQLKYGKVILNLTLTADKHDRGSSELSSWNFMLSMVRNL